MRQLACGSESVKSQGRTKVNVEIYKLLKDLNL